MLQCERSTIVNDLSKYWCRSSSSYPFKSAAVVFPRHRYYPYTSVSSSVSSKIRNVCLVCII